MRSQYLFYVQIVFWSYLECNTGFVIPDFFPFFILAFFSQFCFIFHFGFFFYNILALG
jgi:hypothetical protein